VDLRSVGLAGALLAALVQPGVAQTPEAAEAARRAFVEAARVLLHPRCTNCHNRGEGPRQGDGSRAHQLNVKRGPEGRGEGAGRCTACHRAANTAGGAVPGAPDWRMPPPGRAGWDGLSPAEVCAALKDPARNAGLTVEQTVEHMRTDALVRWAWEPGGRRATPPLAHEAFIALMRQWSERGGACPE
jgi:mono/diheme cytochrome c family protein